MGELVVDNNFKTKLIKDLQKGDVIYLHNYSKSGDTCSLQECVILDLFPRFEGMGNKYGYSQSVKVGYYDYSLNKDLIRIIISFEDMPVIVKV